MIEFNESEFLLWLESERAIDECYPLDFCVESWASRRKWSSSKSLHVVLEMLSLASELSPPTQSLYLTQHLEDPDTSLEQVYDNDIEASLDSRNPRLLKCQRGKHFYAYKGYIVRLSACDLSRLGITMNLENLSAIYIQVEDRGVKGERFVSSADIIFGYGDVFDEFLKSCIGAHEPRPYEFLQASCGDVRCDSYTSADLDQ